LRTLFETHTAKNENEAFVAQNGVISAGIFHLLQRY
jgi:hypothetical protein